MRNEYFNRLNKLSAVDVVILGGGVNGAGVLRECAFNGLSAVLLDTGDFCSGASGASTRMAHGGLRYIENREFSLVRESVKERDHLLQHAPHAVQPLEIVLPVPHVVRGTLRSVLNFLRVGQRRVPVSLLAAKLALTLYDYLCQDRSLLPRHRVKVGRHGLHDRMSSSFKASATYSDGRILHPEAFVMELLAEAVNQSETITALNYVNWSLSADGTVNVMDSQTGDAYPVKPSLIINATGGWVDQVNAMLGVTSDYVSNIHGAHIVVRHDALLQRLNGRAFYFDDGHGRMVICCPLERTVLMGTTEVAADIQRGRTIERSEIDYLCRSLSMLFSDIVITREHIAAVTTGARPLVKSAGKDFYRVHRKHALRVDQSTCATPKVISMIGGKWTTFRSFAEEAADKAFEVLGRHRIATTWGRDFPGKSPDNGAAASGRFHRRYGAIGSIVEAHCNSGQDEALVHVPTYSKREIAWLTHRQCAVELSDLLLRRTTIALDGMASDGALEELSGLMAGELRRNEDWRKEQVRLCKSMPEVQFNAYAAAP